MASNRTEAATSQRPSLAADLIDPQRVATDYGIPENTQAIWRHGNRYGWRDLVFKLGSRVRYRRTDIENWVESRRIGQLDSDAAR